MSLPDDFVEVFSTPDPGECALVRSLLDSQGIPSYELNFNAERMAIWTNPFFRRFGVHVHCNDLADAQELVRSYVTESGDTPISPSMTLLARGLVVFFILTTLFSVIVQWRD